MMSNVSSRVGLPGRARHEIARAVAAVTATFETLFQVFAEAEQQSSAARDRFPLAD
jgi:hypothetical protein